MKSGNQNKIMSRIGKQQINIPEKTEVKVSDGQVFVKGPLGDLTLKIRPEITVKVENNLVTTTPNSDTVFVRSLWGTYSSHILNMVNGVNKPFEKKLVVEGVGFKANVKGKDLVMNLGFSHEVLIKIPDDLNVVAEKNIITVSGIDKEKVGRFSADIRARKKPEPYKGKIGRAHV